MKVVSLFSGAMGLDLGMEAAGHEVVVAVETDKTAVATIRLNRPDLPVIARPIEKVKTSEILAAAGLKAGDEFIVVGGPCCQAFSTVGKRASLGDPRGNLFLEFVRVVRQARPTFFLMENVRGLLSAAERHRPLKFRGPGHPPLEEDELLGSAFARVVDELRKLGYYTIFDVLNAADYGTPQKRERFIAMGSRDGHPVAMPIKTHSEDCSNGLSSWVTVRQALSRAPATEPPLHEPLNAIQQRFLPLIPAGGDWRNLPAKLQREAMGKALDSWGGRTGFLRRLSWDRPAPSLVTNPAARATLLGHPTENRTLSTFEYARIQEFPLCWKFAGSLGATYRQIGNAVPVGLGRALGEALDKSRKSRDRVDERGVFCFNDGLLQRLMRRPTTLLNPAKHRRLHGVDDSSHWENNGHSNRGSLLKKINTPIRKRIQTRHATGQAKSAKTRLGTRGPEGAHRTASARTRSS
ncbi:DNA cytosine methyltransferase [Thermomonas fusca]|uniref:DNA (cytosine-5-)-methyltransferase n=1 Tax=Thermomonas fusca TaxID=215690 RepID=A0A5R9PHD6_9GAMM|nr:DNA cytosine methyltransferase [Thermomonas fusca]TLX22477.1 DNA cytosine methyltransferase [Thermomonas fusca]